MKSLRLLLTGFAIVPMLAFAGTANFDSQTEGIMEGVFSYSEAGITFSDMHRAIPGEDPQISWAIEDANSDLLSRYPAFFSPRNVLGFGGYAPGDGTAFVRVKEFTMTPDTVSNFISLEWFGLFNDGNDNAANLELFRNGNLVRTETFLFPQIFDFYHHTLSVSGTEFDKVRFVTSGPANDGTLFGVIDNVTMNPVPEPASMLALALGAAALIRRRRARK